METTRKSFKIKVNHSHHNPRDFTTFFVRYAFGKIRITGSSNQSRDPDSFFGDIHAAIQYGDKHEFDLIEEMESAGWPID